MFMLSQGMTTSRDPDDMQHIGSTSGGFIADWVQDTGKLYQVAVFGKYGIHFPNPQDDMLGFYKM